MAPGARARTGGPVSWRSVSGIGVLREGPLHAAVKDLLARPGDTAEVPFGRFVIDLVRADGELVEIQTGGFSPLGPKLDALLDAHRMRIVHPVAAERRIVRVDDQGEVLSSRRSPLRGGGAGRLRPARVVPVAARAPEPDGRGPALSRGPHPRAGGGALALGPAASRPGRAAAGRGAGQRGAGVPGRRGRAAARRAGVGGEPFTTRELAGALGCRMLLAQRVAYCLRAMDVLADAGKRGRAPLHRRMS